MPTMITLSLAIVRCGSYLMVVKVESVGKGPEDSLRRVRSRPNFLGHHHHHHNDKHEQTQPILSPTFVGFLPLKSTAHPLIYLTDLISYKVGTKCRI